MRDRRRHARRPLAWVLRDAFRRVLARPAPEGVRTVEGFAERPVEGGFRPDLEGLRAVAVALVLGYHAGVPGLGGGFIGVDVFFVLSGFLITDLLVRELVQTGRISLAAFYARRARRLLPAAAVVLVATLIASAWLMPPLRIPDVAADGLAAGLYASNIKFAIDATDYLQSELDPSPLLHFWSLGVEEQFYLIWPAVLLLTARLTGVTRGRLLGAVLLIGGASMVLSVALTQVAAPWAFYSLPSRAWELALGGALVLLAGRVSKFPRVGARWAAVLGLGLIVLAGAILDTGTPFPGTAALLPTVGAGLVIVAGFGRRWEHPAGAERLLTLPSVRWLGRISYSLYLWHWPIVVLPGVALETELPTAARVALVLAAIPVAAASQRWIEEPFRRGRVFGLGPARNLAMAAGLGIVMTGLAVGLSAWGSTRLEPPVSARADLSVDSVLPDGAAVSREGVISDEEADALLAADPPDSGRPAEGAGDPQGLAGPPAEGAPASAEEDSGAPTSGIPAVPRSGSGPYASTPAPEARVAPVERSRRLPANLAPSLSRARDDVPPIYEDGCHVDLKRTEPGSCTYGDRASTTVIVLLGDSHAAQWFPALERLARTNHWRLVSLTKAACTAADLTVWNANLKRAYSECDTWRQAALARIARERPLLVVVSHARGHAIALDGRSVASQDRPDLWKAALARTLKRLRGMAGGVVVIGDTPRAGVDPPACLSRHRDDVSACDTPAGEAVAATRLALEADIARSAGADFLDPTPWICPADPCPVVRGRLLLYRDPHHLTATFVRALAPRLQAALPTLRAHGP